jgi:competence protein ComEC
MWLFIPLPPSLYLLVGLITGIAWQAATEPYVILSLAAFLTTCIILVLSLQTATHFSTYYIKCSCFMAMFIMGALRYQICAHTYNTFTELLPLYKAELDAIILDCEETEHSRYPYTYTVITQELICDQQTVTSARGAPLKLYMPTPQNDLTIGNRILFKNLYIPPVKNYAYKRYLAKEGLAASCFISKPTYVSIEKTKGAWFKRQRNAIISSLKKKLSPLGYALFSSIFLGKQVGSEHMSVIKNQLQKWGIVHYLARSGLHLTLTIIFISFILRFVPISLTLRVLFTLGILAMYAAFSIVGVSFLRALLAFVISSLAVLCNIPTSALHILSLTACCILIHNPLQLFFLDFQLTFILTYALIWIKDLSMHRKLV